MGNKNEIGKLFCRIINKQDYEKFDNLYLFFAMKKSGQHPIINWINEHTTPSVLYNDCRIFDNSLYYTIKKLYYEKKSESDNKVVYNVKKSKKFEYDLMNDKIDSMKMNSALFNFESISFFDIKDFIKNNFKDKKVIISFIVRDVFNQFSDVNTPSIKLWKEHVKICLGKLDCGFKIVDINFNKWVLDSTYRRNIAKRLEFKFDRKLDNMAMSVIPAPGQSRFNHNKFSNDAREMDVLYRWKIAIEKDFDGLYMIDSEAVKLNRAYFDFIPDAWTHMLKEKEYENSSMY